MKINYKLIFIIAGLISSNCFSQVKLDCNEYIKEDEEDGMVEIICSFEEPPTPVEGYEIFYENIRKETIESVVQGKLFIQFVVDT